MLASDYRVAPIWRRRYFISGKLSATTRAVRAVRQACGPAGRTLLRVAFVRPTAPSEMLTPRPARLLPYGIVPMHHPPPPTLPRYNEPLTPPTPK